MLLFMYCYIIITVFPLEFAYLLGEIEILTKIGTDKFAFCWKRGKNSRETERYATAYMGFSGSV